MYLHFLLFLSLLHVATSEHNTYEYANCSIPLSFSCGSITLNISYPFLAPDRPEYCGLPNYSISCTEGKSTIKVANDRAYLVKEINYTDGILTLAELNSAEGDACPGVLRNTSVDPSLFELTSDNLMLWLFSRYDFGSASYVAGIGSLNCPSNETGLQWYYARAEGDGGLPTTVIGWFNPPVAVWLHRTAVDKLEKGGGWGEAMSRGFDVVWKVGNDRCWYCLQSGGACALDTNVGSCKQESKGDATNSTTFVELT